MSGVESRLLAQERITTTPTTIYTPPIRRIGVVKQIVVANTSGTTTTYRIFLDIGGAVYDENSALFWDVTIGGNTSDLVPGWIPFTAVSSLGIAASANDRLTITIGGYEIVRDETFRERPFGQVRPSVLDTPVSIFSPAAGTRGVVRSIFVSNVKAGGQAANYSVYLDHDGAVFNDTTALARGVSLGSGSTDILSVYLPMEDSAGNLAVETNLSANDLNFTAFGFIEVL